MNIDMEVLYIYSKKFMEKEYSDEASYFDIAWEIFEEIMKDTVKKPLDLKEPTVRLEGDDTVMAPVVIRAFYVLFSELGGKILSRDAILKPSIMEVLHRSKFSPELSIKIVDFLTGA